MSSLLNNASLLLNPAGSIISYQEDKIYSVLPKDGTGDFTFSGGDGGTRVNQQGYIEVTPANLILNSQEVALWATNAGPTINSNVATAPNGTFTADRINAAAAYASGVYQVFTSVSGQTYTLSVSIKNDSSATSLLIGNDANPGTGYVLFNPTTGAITSVAGSVTASSVINEGNGWYRVSITYVSTGTPNAFVIYSVTGGVNSFFVWGAMANIGSTAKPYQPTTDRLNYPRITYQNGRGALLSEPQRTNVLTNSQNLSSCLPSQANTTVTADATISPDGTQNADSILFGTSGYRLQTTSTVSGTSYSPSIFVKNLDFAEGEFFKLNLSDGIVGGMQVTIYPSSKTITTTSGPYSNVSAKVVPYNNDWFRVELSGTANNTGTGWYEIGYHNANKSVYLWGMQLETGLFSTSYIPTTSATVTRPGDVTTKTGASSIINASEGTIYVDFIFGDNDTGGSDQNLTMLYSGGYSNSVFFACYGSSIKKLYGWITNGATQVNIQSPTLYKGQRVKAALTYKNNDYIMYVNGVSAGTQAQPVPSLDTIIIGNQIGGTSQAPNPLATTALFNTRLSNTQLQELTTVRSGSGGNISYYGPYTIHTFTGSATFTPSFNGEVEVLVVAGGGGGGNNHAGGGGAGGLIYASSVGVSQGTGVTVTIGAGGASPVLNADPVTNGSNSVFGGLTAIGGGGGGNRNDSNNNSPGGNGGSGGGGGGSQSSFPGNWVPGNGIPGQGNNGGYGIDIYGGGGGGAGAVGTVGAASSAGGNGGNGLPYSISGFSTYYAGGGGGGYCPIAGGGNGGLGGGGKGGILVTDKGTPGAPYTGAGGGGGGAGGTQGSIGGAGIVIVRYLT